MKIDLQDTKVGGFNYEFLRAISYQKTEGAELGECVATAAHIHEGDFDSWIQEWTRLADRVAQLGKKLPVAELPAEIFAILEKHHGKEIVRNLQGLDLFRNQRGSTDE